MRAFCDNQSPYKLDFNLLMNYNENKDACNVVMRTLYHTIKLTDGSKFEIKSDLLVFKNWGSPDTFRLLRCKQILLLILSAALVKMERFLSFLKFFKGLHIIYLLIGDAVDLTCTLT
jgi:hypothetical protein